MQKARVLLNRLSVVCFYSAFRSTFYTKNTIKTFLLVFENKKVNFGQHNLQDFLLQTMRNVRSIMDQYRNMPQSNINKQKTLLRI